MHMESNIDKLSKYWYTFDIWSNYIKSWKRMSSFDGNADMLIIGINYTNTIYDLVIR